MGHPPAAQPPSLSQIIEKNKTEIAEMRKLDRQRKKYADRLNKEADPAADFISVGEKQSEYDPYERLSEESMEELLRLRQQAKPNSEHYHILSDLIEEREYADEQLDLDELGEELDQIEFFSVKVWDVNDSNWLTADSRGFYDDTKALVASVTKRFPFATKIKWGKAKKRGSVVQALSDKTYPIQSEANAQLSFAEKQNSVMNQHNSQPQFIQPPAQQQMDIPALIQAMASQSENSNRMFLQLLTALNDKPKENPLEQMAVMKDMFMMPQIEMIKALQPKSQGAIDPMALFTTMMTGAKTLSGMGGGGGGGGGVDGILGTLLQYAKPILEQLQQGAAQQQQLPQQNPYQQQQPQQQQLPPPQGQQQQLPPQQQTQPQQTGANVQNPAIATLRARSKKIIENMISGKLQLEQVPRYIWKNGTQEEGELLLQISFEQFREILTSSVNRGDSLIQSYMNKPETVRGVQWIYEEFHRLATVVGICMRSGDEAQAEQLTGWEAGPLMETSAIGEGAQQEFVQRYEITAEDLGEASGEEDLPTTSQEDMPETQTQAPAQSHQQQPVQTEVIRESTPIQNHGQVEDVVGRPSRPRKKKKRPTIRRA